jgi:hypothetical protein
MKNSVHLQTQRDVLSKMEQSTKGTEVSHTDKCTLFVLQYVQA